MDEQRKQFEEWCGSVWFPCYSNGDGYLSETTDNCWIAWQAAQEAAKPKWISVDDELPVVPTDIECDHVDVIVAISEPRGSRSESAIFSNGRFMTVGGDGELYELPYVLKWMHPPKP